MTVIDLRERFGVGRLAGAHFEQRRRGTASAPQAGQEFYARTRGTGPAWRLLLLDTALAVVVVFVSAAMFLDVSALAWSGLVIVWMISLKTAGSYVRTNRAISPSHVGVVVRSAVYVCALSAVASMVFGGLDVAALAATTLALAGATVLGRALLGSRAMGESDVNVSTAVLRGESRDVQVFLDCLGTEKDPAFLVTGVQITGGDSVDPGSVFDSLRTLSLDDDLVEYTQQMGITSVVLVGCQPEPADELRRLIWRLEGHDIDAYLVPVVADIAPPQVRALATSGIPMFACGSRDLGSEAGVSKVILDKALALMGLLALLPVMVASAVAVKLSSPGPVLFRQVRVGLGGREFEMLKFRTMVNDAEARRLELEEQNQHSGGTLFKIPDDPRVTKVGRVLRRYSLDELPQLLNVVRGEMSLVGPRPPLPSEVANYPLDAHRRFCVRPGLTGLWQVSGRSDLSPEESIHLDSHYVEQWSPMMDVNILLRTPSVVISGRGAY